MASPTTRQAQQQAQHEPAARGVEPGHEMMPRLLGDPAGREPRWVTPLPAGKNGSCITRDPRFGRSPGVYPVFSNGTFLLVPPDTMAAGDAINLCYIPYGVYMVNFTIVTSGVTGMLQDSLATPTQYGNVTGAVFTPANLTGAMAQNFLTMYAQTPRAIGKDGPAVVQWQRGMVLQIANAAGASATPMIYSIEWAPVFDSGV